MKRLTRRCVLVEDDGQSTLVESDTDAEEARPLQAGAVTYRIAFGPRAARRVLTPRGGMPREAAARQPLCADIDGFSLHAAVRIEAHDRKRLERLCRYITRPGSSPTWGWIPGRRPGDGRARPGDGRARRGTRSPQAEKRAPSGARAMGWRASAAAGVAAARRLWHQARARGRSQEPDPRLPAARKRSRPGSSEWAPSRRAAPLPMAFADPAGPCWGVRNSYPRRPASVETRIGGSAAGRIQAHICDPPISG
jgi:hypothetical protein